MNKLTFFTLTIFLHLHVSLSSDPFFGTCPTKFCGQVEVTYPFRIIGQQHEYCGYPGFEVSCENGKIPFVNISGDPYVIQQIWYTNQSFQVTNPEFLNDTGSNCWGSIRNLTLDGAAFKFATNYTQLALFLKCPEKNLQEYKHDLLKCGTLALYENDPGARVLAGVCGEVVFVPFEGERGSNLTEVLSRGVVLNWTANNCSACVESRGQCGFDVQTKEPKCFCSDRAHAYHCLPRNRHLGVITGLVIAGCVILLIALLICWYLKKIKFIQPRSLSRGASLEHTSSDLEKGNIYFGVPLFSYMELVEATDNFNHSRELGDGGFGTVYYGKLRDGREVAIKRLYEKSYKRVEQFMNEVQILTCLRHQNLVSLYGCTSHHSRELLLVYEYVPNGTVADHLYGDKAKPGSVPWHVRMSVAIETASALSYLHASDIIHRDVKTNNILLDSNFIVKVADFGLSRLFPNDVTHVSTAPQGTPGYLDPEYHQCYQLTSKSDVYSFGVVLIELISSLPAVDMNRSRQEINLSNYAMNRIQRCAFDELVDPGLGFMSDFKVRKMTTSVAELAFQCLQLDKEFRPSMDEVLEALKRIESADYEALKAEEGVQSDEVETSTKPQHSPIQSDDAKLLANNQLHLSPISVMDKWASSRSTTHSTSK